MGPHTPTPAHVLVIASDELVRTNLAALARQVGYRSAAVPDLARARTLIDDSWVRYDVVVIDVSGDSFEDVDHLEELVAEYDIGLVLVTAPDDIRAMQTDGESGAIGFITIPISAAKVLRGIAGVLRQIQARRRNAWYATMLGHGKRPGGGTVIDITDPRASASPPSS